MTPTFFTSDNNIECDEFQAVLPVNTNASFETLSPGIADAERKYILPILGNTYWNTLKTYYNGRTSTNRDAAKDDIIEMIQSATIRIAFFENFDILSITLTDAGVQNPSGESSPYRYQADAAKETLGRQAFEKLQLLYDSLTDYNPTGWTPSETHLCRRHSKLIPSYREFFQAVEMPYDYRLFSRLMPTVTMAEKTKLPYTVGKTIAKNLVQDGTVTDEVVISLARRLVSFHALADSVMLLHALISDEGVVTCTIKADGAKGGKNLSTTDKNTRLRLQQTYREYAEGAAKELLDYLQANAEDFPTIEEVLSSGFSRLPKNDKKSKIFRV